MTAPLPCIVVALASLAVVRVAAASCADGGRNERARAVGQRQGDAMVEAAWNAVSRDCRSRARVEQSVRDALRRRVAPTGASETLRCRDAGFRQGADEALARIAAACTSK